MTEYIELTDSSGDNLAVNVSEITAFNTMHDRDVNKTYTRVWAKNNYWDVIETYSEIKEKMVSLGY